MTEALAAAFEPIRVTLSSKEVAMAVGIASHEFVENPRSNDPRKRINGLLAQMAFAKARGIYFPGYIPEHYNIEAKIPIKICFQKEEGGRLLLEANADDRFYHVLITPAKADGIEQGDVVMCIAGVIKAKAAKKECFLDSGGWYAVPQEALRDPRQIITALSPE